MIEVFGIFLMGLSVIAAVATVRARNLFVAVMLMSMFSLLLASVFFLFDAADVALTEAAVGAGVSTVLLLGALALTAEKECMRGPPPYLSLLVVLVMGLTMAYATVEKPRHGDPQAPVHQHVAPWYLEKTPELIDIPNVVTAVLASFRGYDTLGEVIVVFTAGIGVLFMIGPLAPRAPGPAGLGAALERGLRRHQPLRILGKLLIPFILLFALYVQFHGEYSPGGGFQAGTLVAASVVLYSLLEGERRALAALPPRALHLMAAGGPLIYGGVGLLCMLRGGAFLEYRVLAEDPITAQHLGIIAIEIGVGVTVAGVLLAIYHAFAARGT